VVSKYTVTKKNEIMAFLGKWMELENMNLSEVTQKTKACMFSPICGI
jgi:hypothetical protein